MPGGIDSREGVTDSVHSAHHTGNRRQTAGPGTPSLVDEGMSLVKKDQLGAADLFAEAAQSSHIANSGKLSAAAEPLRRDLDLLQHVSLAGQVGARTATGGD